MSSIIIPGSNFSTIAKGVQPVRIDRVLQTLQRLAPPGAPIGATAEEISAHAGLLRQNASAELNALCRQGMAVKRHGRPVQFWAAAEQPSALAVAMSDVRNAGGFEDLVGHGGSLQAPIEQAKAAMLYPPRGLPTLIIGPTGSGKSRFAEAMYAFGIQSGRLKTGAPFIIFNCADYAMNPQLLLSQLFGHARGAFTGADRSNPGIVAQANGGVLFLDEIHRLPPEGQEMLFILMDRGIYRPLGDSTTVSHAEVRLIGATSEEPEAAFLATFLRRFPAIVSLPSLEGRLLVERFAMVELFLTEESARVGAPVSVGPLALVALLTFKAIGNVGELRTAISLGCAKAFLQYIACEGTGTMLLNITHLAPQIQLAYLRGGEQSRAAERLVGPEDRCYAPNHLKDSPAAVRDRYLPPDLYTDLRNRVSSYVESGLAPAEVQQLIQTDLDYYLRQLVRPFGEPPRIPDGWLDAVSVFVRDVGAEVECRFGQAVVMGLALHLASRPPTGSPPGSRPMATVIQSPRTFAAVKRLAPALAQRLGASLTPEDLAFVALFLAAHERSGAVPGIGVMVIAHGETTASSMADVANQVIGVQIAMATNVPMGQGVEATVRLALGKLRQMSPALRGLVLLADMAPLTLIGPALEQATGVPVQVVPLVTTSAVVEACRAAARPHADTKTVVAAAQRVYSAGPAAPAALPEGLRIILTTCLTGEGTAGKLAAFIEDALPPDLRQTIAVRSVCLNPLTLLPEFLADEERQAVIAVAGTVDPHMPEVPFIGMEQLVFGDGLRRLARLAAGEYDDSGHSSSPNRLEAVELARRFVLESMASADGDRAAAIAISSLVRLEELLEQSCSPGQAARWVIHFSFALERLTVGQAVPRCADVAYLQEHHGRLLELIRQVVDGEAAAMAISVPDSEIGYLALIILSE
jgi:transcriptional regulator with AAA-type ATPase domain/transcriptional regulatory protein LevR